VRVIAPSQNGEVNFVDSDADGVVSELLRGL
jgi:hypothetical protein